MLYKVALTKNEEEKNIEGKGGEWKEDEKKWGEGKDKVKKRREKNVSVT